ncbi:MAG: hypothetical protein DWQ10_02230 [Calditrichaeota bacterium]|nr:MAG: hypothetical protein DWQ10_02230 [Calditrichota bacterium]
MQASKFHAFALFFFAFRVAYAANPLGDNQPADTFEQRERLHTIIQQARAVVAELTELDVRSRFGKPVAIQTNLEQNKYVPEIQNRFIVLKYDKYVFRIFKSANTQTEFITHFSLLSSNDDLRWGLKTGISELQIRYLLGAPEFTDRGVLVYEDRQEEPTVLLVHVRNGRVTRLDFCFYFE